MKSILSSKWYALALTLAATLLVAGIGRMCMPVLFKEISVDLNLNLVEVGVVWGVDPLAGVFMSIPGGLLADRFGIKRTTMVICILFGILGALRGLAFDFATLTLITFLAGAVGSTIATVGTKATVVWFTGKYLKLTNALIFTAVFLGQMIGAQLSATVLSPLLGGWRNVLIIYSIPLLITGILWATFKGTQPSIAGLKAARTVTIGLGGSILHVMRVRNIWIVGFLLFAISGAITGVNGYLPLYLRGIGWAPAVADSAVTLMLGSALVGTLPIMFLSGRLTSPRAAVIISALFMAVCIALVPVSSGAATWILVIATGFLRSIPAIFCAVLVLELKDIGSEYAGTAIGVTYSLGMLGGFLFPPLGNSLASINPGLPFVFWAVLCMIFLGGFFFMKKQSVLRT